MFISISNSIYPRLNSQDERKFDWMHASSYWDECGYCAHDVKGGTTRWPPRCLAECSGAAAAARKGVSEVASDTQECSDGGATAFGSCADVNKVRKTETVNWPCPCMSYPTEEG